MGERLQIYIDVPESLRSFALPPLLLQPLVENALVHGLDPKLEGGRIDVDARSMGDFVLIRVADTGRGFGWTQQGNGVGLRNVREQLAELYGNQAELNLFENPGGGVTAELKLPEPKA